MAGLAVVVAIVAAGLAELPVLAVAAAGLAGMAVAAAVTAVWQTDPGMVTDMVEKTMERCVSEIMELIATACWVAH